MTPSTHAYLGVAFLAGVVASCGQSTPKQSTKPPPGKDAGDPRTLICDANPADGGAPPPFSVIQRLFTEECVECHTSGADLDLSAGRAWAALVRQPAPSAESCGGTLVVPGDPAHSYLYQKVSTATPCTGLQMPRGDFGSNPLPACAVALIHDWIAAGAAEAPSDAGGD